MSSRGRKSIGAGSLGRVADLQTPPPEVEIVGFGKAILPDGRSLGRPPLVPEGARFVACREVTDRLLVSRWGVEKRAVFL